MGSVSINVALGASIKRLRRKAGLTQVDLSQRSGLFRTHLSRIESGTANPSLDAIVAIAHALDTAPARLLDCPHDHPMG